MTHTIYIEQRPLFLSSTPLLHSDETRHLKTTFSGERGQLLHYAQILEQANCPYSAITVVGDADAMMSVFAANYKLQEAAGGVVRNPEGNILLIFRRGFWDLPKGKIDARSCGRGWLR
jgi:hypothetical protein